ncbi:hypothetical protein ACFQ9X_34840 [Catenulispora yoronensis]
MSTSTNTITTRIPLQTNGGSVRFAPTGKLAYVNDLDHNTVDVIDTSTHTLRASIPVGPHPLPVVFDTSGSRAFTASRDHSTLSIVDTAAADVTQTVPSIMNAPGAIAEAPNGKLILVGSSLGGVLREIDPAGRRAVGPALPLPDTAQAITFSPNSRLAYITTLSGTLVTFDTATGRISDLAIGGFLGGLAQTPDSRTLYVADHDSVAVVDTASNTLKTKIPLLGSGAQSVAVSPDGADVYVTDRSGAVSVIDVATDSRIVTVFTPADAQAVAFTPDGRTAYVAADSIVAVNTASHSVAATITDSAGPASLAVTPDGTQLFVDNAGADSVSVIDTATDTITATIPIGSPGNSFGLADIVIGH